MQGKTGIRGRTPVWVTVMINQLAFPGLGTILAGRRAGYAQAAIMVAGFLLVMGYLVWFLTVAVRSVANPSWDEAEFHAQYRPYLWALYDGLGLCLIAWLWALWSSVSIWRAGHPTEGSPG